MTREEINIALKELNSQEMSPEIINQGKPLLEAYQLAIAHHLHELKEKFIADGGTAEEFKIVRDEHDVLFDELWAEHSKLKKDFKFRMANLEGDNLKLKEELLEKINALKSEEHIKKAHTDFKEIELKWKEIGKIPQDKIKDIELAYSRARDEFFYNMHIYRELLENDLKKNLQLKEEIVSKMKEVVNLKSFKDMDSVARRLTNEWNEIGPTYKEKWEGIRDEFWEAHHLVFDRIKDFYKGQKEKQKDNLEKKQALVVRLKEINGYHINSDKSWKKHTKTVIDLQKEWRGIGFAPKADNEKVWGEFKSLADSFFHAKSDFYKSLKDEFDNNKHKKEALLSQAEELVHHEDKKYATNMITKLQKQWRDVGAAHHRDEQKLWKKFRATCNSFFEGKKEQQKQNELDQKENLVKKQAVLKSIESLEKSAKTEDALSSLDTLIKEFNAIGFVPLADKNVISKQFKETVEKQLGTLGLPEAEMKDYLFNLKIKEMSNSQNSDRALDQEAKFLKDKIRTIKGNILQYENNLGFFSNSKGAEALIKEVNDKIETNKQQLQALESKLQMVYNNME